MTKRLKCKCKFWKSCKFYRFDSNTCNESGDFIIHPNDLQVVSELMRR